MNTPTPAQALGECLRLSGGAIYGPWETGGESDPLAILSSVTYVQIAEFNPAQLLGITNAAFACTAVNFIRQHGQHFAGLEAEVAILKNNLEAQEACTKSVSEAYDERNETCATLTARAEAAEARVREAEGLLRHWQAWICGPSELHKATATFLATSGESK